MKEVVITAWCDEPLSMFGITHDVESGHPRVAADKEIPLTLEGHRYNLDCCADCAEKMEDLLSQWQDLAALVGKKRGPRDRSGERKADAPRGGAERKRPPRRGEPTDSEINRTCPVCAVLSPTRSALGQHLTQKHNSLLSDYQDVWELVE